MSGAEVGLQRVRGLRITVVGGVPIYLSRTWPILVAVIVLYFGPQVARSVPDLGAATAYLVAGAYALLLMLSVLAHEAAHAVAARGVGSRVARIVIDLFGGHTVYETSGLTPGRAALIAVAGPLANGVLAAVGWFVLPHLPEGVPWLLGTAFVLTNGVVGAFNLVPGHPLDGGHLLDALVWKVTGRRHLGMIVSGIAGRLVVVALVSVFVIVPLMQGSPPSFLMLAWAGLVGAVLWSGASQAVHTGRHLGAYGRVSLESVLTDVHVVDAGAPLRAVLADVDRATTTTGRAPVVLLHGLPGAGEGGAPGMGLLEAPVDTGAAPRAAAAEFGARLPEGWLVDVDDLPPVAAIVDHMHDHAAKVVVLRFPDGRVRAVTADAVTSALARAGGRS